jgi:hypothetical protein
VDQLVLNEANRDHHLANFSNILQDKITAIINEEVFVQQALGNHGNINLLCVLKEVAQHAAEIDF